ncbi:hypothetical protein chiPu_0010807 [Chiloscyllium punctatum]|uniref:Uncharacterized protein n=1 Tax=Chiloscyllium punctatum TaxID=137246 RepID=A0A401SPP7_CHIPU|nr:hypothetical protein [Chiloscyllium punctatum]
MFDRSCELFLSNEREVLAKKLVNTKEDSEEQIQKCVHAVPNMPLAAPGNMEWTNFWCCTSAIKKAFHLKEFDRNHLRQIVSCIRYGTAGLNHLAIDEADKRN